MEPETQAPAPPVVAVVVSCDAGPWFEQALQSLADQDYPNLSVLVVDSASHIDPTMQVRDVLPGAFVTRLPKRVTFGRAITEALALVDGASHLLLCHDDVVLAPDAVRLLVEEAFRSNAGIATPKYVRWSEPDRLIAVGRASDKVGVVHDLVDPGELDQQQHDAVREVFVAPSGVTLVRADLFRAIGGFDRRVEQFGEDLDLSWRAHVAGARVVTVPAARVRHLEALTHGERVGWASGLARRRAAALAEEHRLYTLLTCYRWFELLWILPVAVIFMGGEVVTRIVQGHPADAGRLVRAFAAGFGHPLHLMSSRRRVQQHRRTGDAAIRRLQSRGNARLRAFLRSQVEGVRQGYASTAVSGAFRRPDPGRAGWRDAGDGPDDAGPGGDLIEQRRRPAGSGRSRSRSSHPAAAPWRRPGVGAGIEEAAGLGGNAGRAGGLLDGPASGGDRLADDGGPGARVASLDARRRTPTGPGPGRVVGPGAAGVGAAARPGWRSTLTVAVVLLVVVGFGSRALIGHELPAVAQLPNTSGGWAHLWRSWWSTWQGTDLGVAAPASPALALLGLLGTVLFGAVGTLQHVVVLGPLLVGPYGAYRAARWWGSGRGRLVALVVYAAVPLPYDALARGHWAGLIAYAAAPWLVGLIARLSGDLPFPANHPRHIVLRAVGLGLLTAATASAAPSVIYVVPIIGVALSLGFVLVGRPRQGVRPLLVAAGGAAVGFVLLLPWSAAVLSSGVATSGIAAGPAGRYGFGRLLRFDVGPVAHGYLSWAILAAAALPLVIGQSWRLAWAARLWAVALICVAVAWAGSRGWLPALPVEVLLAPAAAALAGSAALGAVSFELDLPGYRFGWRQLAAGVSVVALAVGSIPVLVTAANGRWHLPNADADSVLAFLGGSGQGDYRVLWVGAPDALPLAGRQLYPGIAYATSYNGPPDVADQWITSHQGASPVLAQDLRLVEDHLTTQLGHLLAPAAVQYIVIPNHSGPAGTGAPATATPAALLDGLTLQTDLQAVNADADYTVYKNAAWAPARTILRPAAAAAAAVPAAGAEQAAQDTDLAGSVPVLSGGSPGRVRGALSGPATLYVSDTRDASWRLRVGGRSIAPEPAFGWAMSFAVPAGVSTGAVLASGPPWTTRAAQWLQVVLWIVVVLAVALDARRRQVRRGAADRVDPEWFAPAVSGFDHPHRRRGNGALGSDDLLGDEMWIDA